MSGVPYPWWVNPAPEQRDVVEHRPYANLVYPVSESSLQVVGGHDHRCDHHAPQTQWEAEYASTTFEAPYSVHMEGAAPDPFPPDYRMPDYEHALGRDAPRNVTKSEERIWNPDVGAQMRDYEMMRVQTEDEHSYLRARWAIARDFEATNTGRRDPYTKVIKRVQPVERNNI